MEPEQQVPLTTWCGGINRGQDVSIRLVPNGINQQQVTGLGSQEPLAVVKVHSARLKRHSKYFQACLSRRWTHPDEPPSIEFNLELLHGLQVASYTDCFSRMYTPLRNNFKDVKSSLELLQVASQIEFLELVNPICRYLSTVLWSEEDELRIRQFSSSPDFPRSHVEDLVARLQVGEHGNEEYRKRLLRDHIKRIIRVALSTPVRSVDRHNIYIAQSLFEDLFRSIQQSEVNSSFEIALVSIVSKEVKEKLESLHEDCRKHAKLYDVSLGKQYTDVAIARVSSFVERLEALCWALEFLLKARVAEEVVECLVHLELFSSIIIAAQRVDSRKPASERVSTRFAKLVIFIFREVVAGRVLLSIPGRVLLFESWMYLYYCEENDTLAPSGYRQAAEDLFLTLPFEQQMEVLQWSQFIFQEFISRSSLISLMKRNWPASEEDALPQVDMEAGVQAEVQLN